MAWAARDRSAIDLWTFRVELAGMPMPAMPGAVGDGEPGAVRAPAVLLNQPGLKVGGDAALADAKLDSNAVRPAPSSNRCRRVSLPEADDQTKRMGTEGLPSGLTTALPGGRQFDREAKIRTSDFPRPVKTNAARLSRWPILRPPCPQLRGGNPESPDRVRHKSFKQSQHDLDSEYNDNSQQADIDASNTEYQEKYNRLNKNNQP